MSLFPLLILLCSFAVTNHSHDSNYMLSRESYLQDLGVVLGTPDTLELGFARATPIH